MSEKGAANKKNTLPGWLQSLLRPSSREDQSFTSRAGIRLKAGTSLRRSADSAAAKQEPQFRVRPVIYGGFPKLGVSPYLGQLPYIGRMENQMEQQMEHVVASRQCIYRIYRISAPIMESQVKKTETGVVYRDCCTVTINPQHHYYLHFPQLPTHLTCADHQKVCTKQKRAQAGSMTEESRTHHD